MAGVRLENIYKSFGRTEVIRGLGLEIDDGEFCVFLGPSGCGKSTLLRLIAGLEETTAGRIYIGGQDVTRLPPKQRGVAMVFQSYALYPHMSARENMAFGLNRGGMKRVEVERRVLETARLLHLEALLDRRPAALSGGQRQRVAIGRAMVKEPAVFLLDEPLSNLDAELRVRMRLEFARLHRRLGTTMVYVTHDQVEAMTLAEKMVVLDRGRIAQVGRPLELYRRPRNLFVAGFLGSPRMNFIPGRIGAVQPGRTEVILPGNRAVVAEVDARRVGPDAAVMLGIRPEHIRAARDPHNGFTGEVTLTEHLGDQVLVYLDWHGGSDSVVMRLQEGRPPAVGERIGFEIPSDACHLFDDKGIAFEPGDIVGRGSSAE